MPASCAAALLDVVVVVGDSREAKLAREARETLPAFLIPSLNFLLSLPSLATSHHPLALALSLPCLWVCVARGSREQSPLLPCICIPSSSPSTVLDACFSLSLSLAD